MDVTSNSLVGELLKHIAGHSGVPDDIGRCIRLDGKLGVDDPVMKPYKRRVQGKMSVDEFVKVFRTYFPHFMYLLSALSVFTFRAFRAYFPYFPCS